MSPIPRRTLALSPHPSTAGTVVEAIEVTVTREPHGFLTLAYTLRADPSALRIPSARPARRAEELWRHTCFEAFIAERAAGPYLELNFSPSGEWASYEFSAYRERAREAADTRRPAQVPSITLAMDGRTLSLETRTELTWLRGDAPGRLALAAVIEDTAGRLSYWALRHPPGKPDFHHPDGFASQI